MTDSPSPPGPRPPVPQAPQFGAPPQFGGPPQHGAPPQFAAPPAGPRHDPVQTATQDSQARDWYGPAPAPTRTQSWGFSGIAIGAFVLSLLSLVAVIFGGMIGFITVVALALGIQAIKETRSTGQRGLGLAIAGVVVSGVAILLFVILLAVNHWLG